MGTPAGKRATEVSAPFGADVAIASSGDLLVLDGADVWRVGPDAIMHVVAGIGRTANSREPDNGDGGPAVQAFVEPTSIAPLPDGGFLIAEQALGRVRRVWDDGTITTVAGSVPPWQSEQPMSAARGDGGPATKATIEPVALASTADGGYLVLEPARVRKVAADGTIMTVAGTGVAGFAGDGGPAVRGRLHAVDDSCIDDCGDIAATADGGFLIADTLNDRIRKVGADGRIATVAGSGRSGSRADGVLAVRTPLERPIAVAPTPAGGFRFFEDWQSTVREVSANGIVSTVVGHGAGTSWAVGAPVGDGGPARDALIDPQGRGLIPTPDGGWIFTEDARLRLVTPAMPSRLNAAVVSLSGGTRAPLIRLATTGEGTARVTLRAPDGHLATSATQMIAAGDGAIQLSSVNAGRYWLDLTVTGSENRFTSHRLAVVLGPILPETAARRAIEHRIANDYPELTVGDCRRDSLRRIDCQVHTSRRCTGIHAVILRNTFTFVRRYGCRAGFRHTPRWLEASQPWPSVGTPDKLPAE